MKKWILIIGLLIPALSQAQNYAINWYKVAGGGGTSAGTNGTTVYSVSGTIGQQDAGENLNQLLERRAAGLDQPMQMCDALSRNEPREFHTLLCHCLLHGRRQFVEVVENFPEECRKVIESLREVYRFDALAKEQKLSDLDRLAFHQAHSQPVMDDLQKWMQEQMEQPKVVKLLFPSSSADFNCQPARND